ncbi:MAG: hypothetical protein M1838_005211 [Thelocarpon superellum]|nr:MAG: hypothetical protein M1838_005211 [Thelocarpon superellum]
MRALAIVPALLLALSSPASASALPRVPIVVPIHHGNLQVRALERPSKRGVEDPAGGDLVRRQDSTNGTMDPQLWDTDTQAACLQSLSALNGTASNPSGMAVCYNLPSLNNETGVFQADLRLYQVSPMIGAWEGLSEQDVSVGLVYQGASVSADGSTLAQRSEGDRGMEKRQSLQSPQLLQGFNFVGQMNQDLINKALSLDDLKKYLAPNVTLTATGKNGAKLSTELSAKDASFVNGILSDVASTCATLACLAPPGTPFIMPGQTLGIFPTGLVVTCLWTLAGFIVVGYGTMGRYQFRQQYRRRVKRNANPANKGNPI